MPIWPLYMWPIYLLEVLYEYLCIMLQELCMRFVKFSLFKTIIVLITMNEAAFDGLLLFVNK